MSITLHWLCNEPLQLHSERGALPNAPPCMGTDVDTGVYKGAPRVQQIIS